MDKAKRQTPEPSAGICLLESGMATDLSRPLSFSCSALLK